MGQRHLRRHQPAPLAGELAQRGERRVELGLGVRPAALRGERGRDYGLGQRLAPGDRRRRDPGRRRQRQLPVRAAQGVEQTALERHVDGRPEQAAERRRPSSVAAIRRVGQQPVEGQRPAQAVHEQRILALHEGARALAHEGGAEADAGLQGGAQAVERAGEHVGLHRGMQAVEQRLVDAVGQRRVQQRRDVVQPGRQPVEQFGQYHRARAAQCVQAHARDRRAQRGKAAVALAAEAGRRVGIRVREGLLQRGLRRAGEQRRIHHRVHVQRQRPEAGAPLVLVREAGLLQPRKRVAHQLLRRRHAAGRAHGRRRERVRHPGARARQRAQRERRQRVTRGRVERRQGIVGNRRGHRSCSVAGRCAAAARQWTDPGSDDRVLNGISGPRA